MRLKWFIWTLLGMAMFMLLWQFFTKSYDLASGYFCGTLILFATELDLVRTALAALRRISTTQDKS